MKIESAAAGSGFKYHFNGSKNRNNNCGILSLMGLLLGLKLIDIGWQSENVKEVYGVANAIKIRLNCYYLLLSILHKLIFIHTRNALSPSICLSVSLFSISFQKIVRIQCFHVCQLHQIQTILPNQQIQMHHRRHHWIYHRQRLPHHQYPIRWHHH